MTQTQHRRDERSEQFVHDLLRLAARAAENDLADYCAVLDALADGAATRLGVDHANVPVFTALGLDEVPIPLTVVIEDETAAPGRTVRIALSGIESMSDELYAADKVAEYALLDAEQAEDDAARRATDDDAADDAAFEFHRDQRLHAVADAIITTGAGGH